MKTKLTHNSDSRKFYVAGIGAIGGLIAGQFSRNTCPVTLLLKDDTQLSKYEKAGLTLIHPTERFTCYPEAISITHVEGRIKRLIVCVKAYDVMTVLNVLKDHVTQESLIILIHNGLGVLEEIEKNFPHLRIITGISRISAYYDFQFTIRCFMTDKIYLGVSRGTFTENEIKEVKHIFKKAKIPFSWTSNISFVAWKKFAVNCIINILSALYSCKFGELLKHEKVLEELAQEISCVLKAYNIKISAKNLLETVVLLLTLNSESYSSMLQDRRRRKKTELPYLNLYLVKLAQQKSISVPLNLKLIEELTALTLREKTL